MNCNWEIIFHILAEGKVGDNGNSSFTESSSILEWDAVETEVADDRSAFIFRLRGLLDAQDEGKYIGNS